jgi:hypothetical protein
MTKPFRYFRDPLFLAALGVFALNEVLLKSAFSSVFMRNHLNDLLLVPCALPPLLRLHAALGLRPLVNAPSAIEIAGHLLVWSILFEVAGPVLAAHSTGDFLDILFYWLGGCCSWSLWNATNQPCCRKSPA